MNEINIFKISAGNLINLSDLNDEQIANIKDELTFKFDTYTGYKEKVVAYTIITYSKLDYYLSKEEEVLKRTQPENSRYILVPYKYELSIPHKITSIVSFDSKKYLDNLKGVTPRQYQKDFFLELEQDDAFTKKSSLFNVDTGHGKTIMSIFHFCSISANRVIVSVPSNYLAIQWRKAISNITDYNVVLLKPSSKAFFNDLSDNTVYIITYDLIDSISHEDKRYANLLSLFKIADIIVYDECHNLGAKTLFKLHSLPVVRKLYLTATFRRYDGKESIMSLYIDSIYTMPSILWKPKTHFLHIGNSDHPPIFLDKKLPLGLKEDEFLSKFSDVIYCQSPSPIINSYSGTEYSFTPSYHIKSLKEFRKFCIDNFIPIKDFSDYLYSDSYVKACTQLSYSYNSLNNLNKHILSAIEVGRKVLVISNRLNCLWYLYSQLVDSALVTGDDSITDDFLVYLNSKSVILGSLQIADEGIDIPDLDTLYVITPKKDLQQAYGRIRRIFEGKKYPLVYIVETDIMQLNNVWTPNSDIFKSVSLNNVSYIDYTENKSLKRVK